MKVGRVIELIGKAAKKPPHVVAHRVLLECTALKEQIYAPHRNKNFSIDDVCRMTGHQDLNSLWGFLQRCNYQHRHS